MTPTLMTGTVRRVMHHVGGSEQPTRRERLRARVRAIRILGRLGYSANQIGLGVSLHHTTVLHHLGRLSRTNRK
jgi:hypothetical protein